MKKLLLGLGTLSLAISPVLAVVSCGSNQTGQTLNAQEFNVVETINSSKVATQEMVIDPAFNTNAQEILINKINTLTKEMLQKDFDLILTDFYDIYEFENENTEIELVDKGIKVLSIEGTANETTGFRTAKLQVSYEMETEVRDDVSQVLTEEIDWVIKPVISSQAQIDEITLMIKDAETNMPGIDIKDLKEYFLGEKEDDNDFDDLGVFDRINALNFEKNLNNLGGLIGYELKLSDIYTQIAPKAAITMDTIFFAPSASLDNTFVYPSEVGKFQYEFNTTFLATVDETAVIEMKTPEDLLSILIKSETNTEMAKLVSGITIEDMGSLLKLTVNFIDPATLSEVISINPSLLKQPVTPVV